MTDASRDAAPTARDERMLRLMNEPRLHALTATRRRRLALVASHIGLTLLADVALVLLFATDGAWWIAALALISLAWIINTGLLNSATRGLLELRARMLDERQHAERGAAFTIAYRVAFALKVVIAAIALAIIFLSEGNEFVGLVALFLLVQVHWLLPLWTAAVMTKDDPDELAASATPPSNVDG